MFRQAISRIRALSTPNISAAKSLTPQWEPALRFPSPPHDPEPATPEDQTGPWFNTYTAFDPSCARPFLISGLSIGIKDMQPTELIPSPSTTRDVVKADMKPGIKKVAVQMPKPWPYRLPKALQPQVGTTFAAMYGGGEGEGKGGKVGGLQAVLYGVPEPDNKDLEGKEEGVWRKVLYGVKEDGEEK